MSGLREAVFLGGGQGSVQQGHGGTFSDDMGEFGFLQRGFWRIWQASLGGKATEGCRPGERMTVRGQRRSHRSSIVITQ